MHLNEHIFVQRVKSKCIVDYNFSGKCVIRDCLKAESIASLNLEASQVPLDDWIGIFNHEDKEKDGMDKKERSMRKASPLGNDVMKEVLMFHSRHVNVPGLLHPHTRYRYMRWPRSTELSIRTLNLVSQGELHS